MKDILEFLKSKLFLKHLAIALVSIIVFFWLILRLISFYTNHGEKLAVPDFRGKSFAEAQKIAKENHLRLEITDSIFSDEYAKGTIVAQNPPTGFSVKPRRTIYLTLNSTLTEKVDMPNLIDESIGQAKMDLETAGLQVGNLVYVEGDFQNLVLKQRYQGRDISAKTKIAKGELVELVLGKGKKDLIGSEDNRQVKSTTAPQLTGYTLKEARRKAVDVYFNISRIYYDSNIKTRKDSLRAIVYKQSPLKGFSTEQLGSSMEVWLTTDKLKVVDQKFKPQDEVKEKDDENTTTSDDEEDED